MKKVFFLIIIILFLISCKKDVDVPKIQIGTAALKIEFLPQAPPLEIHEDEIFNIIAEVKNVGTQDIDDSQDSNGLIIVDVDDQYLRINKQAMPLLIEGKSLANPAGGFLLLQRQVKSKKLPVQQERMNTKITIGACFKYSTTGGMDVCIDTIPEKTGRKACIPQTKSFAGGQGAPVAITKIESRMLPSWDDKKTIPEFIIYFQNLGGGEIINKDKVLYACDAQESDLLERSDFDLVDVEVSIPDGPLTCNKPSVSLQLSDKKIVCRFDKDGGLPKSRAAFTTTLNFRFDYGYFQTAVKQIIISKV